VKLAELGWGKDIPAFRQPKSTISSAAEAARPETFRSGLQLGNRCAAVGHCNETARRALPPRRLIVYLARGSHILHSFERSEVGKISHQGGKRQ
jgi:hypothetical protein